MVNPDPQRKTDTGIAATYDSLRKAEAELRG